MIFIKQRDTLRHQYIFPRVSRGTSTLFKKIFFDFVKENFFHKTLISWWRRKVDTSRKQF